MEYLEKRSTKWLGFFLAILFSFAICGTANSAWYSTYADVSDTTYDDRTISGYPKWQNILMPTTNGVITQIKYRIKDYETPWDNPIGQIDYKWHDSNTFAGTTDYTTICTSTASQTGDWQTCIFDEPINIENNYLVLRFSSGADRISWGSKTPSTSYENGILYKWNGLGYAEEDNSDIQVIYEIEAGLENDFAILYPENETDYPWDLESDNEMLIHVQCYSSSSEIAIFNHEYEYLGKDYDDINWISCDQYGYAFDNIYNLQYGLQNIIVIDSNYLTATYDYYKRQITIQGVPINESHQSLDFAIQWPLPTSWTQNIPKYEELYDDDADDLYNFNFRVNNQNLFDDYFLSSSWTIKIWQGEPGSMTQIIESDIFSYVSGTKSIVVPIPVSSTWQFYKAILIENGEEQWNDPELWWWANATTTATELNEGYTDDVATLITEQEKEIGVVRHNWCDDFYPQHWYNISDAVIYGLCKMFVPDPNDTLIAEELFRLKEHANKTFLFADNSSMYAITTTPTTTPWLVDLKDLFILQWLREATKWILFLFTGWYVFRRLRNYFKN